MKYGFGQQPLAARAIDAALIDGAPMPMLFTFDRGSRPVRQFLRSCLVLMTREPAPRRRKVSGGGALLQCLRWVHKRTFGLM